MKLEITSVWMDHALLQKNCWHYKSNEYGSGTVFVQTAVGLRDLHVVRAGVSTFYIDSKNIRVVAEDLDANPKVVNAAEAFNEKTFENVMLDFFKLIQGIGTESIIKELRKQLEEIYNFISKNHFSIDLQIKGLTEVIVMQKQVIESLQKQVRDHEAESSKDII